MKYILIAGSGTGGHIFPAIAVAKELKKLAKDIKLLFVNSGQKRFINPAFYELGEIVNVPGTGMPRKISIRFLLFLIQTIRSVIRSLIIIKKYRPCVAVGFGNFGSFGPLRAAALKGIPVFLHEANSIPGKANRLLAKSADSIAVNFPNTTFGHMNKKINVVGMPVREEFENPPLYNEALKYYGFDENAPVLLVTGGSQGARHINEVVFESLPYFKEIGIQIIHLTGKNGYQPACQVYKNSGIKYCVKEFETDMKKAFDAADIVIARSGASSLAEISATGKPAILIPYPHATDKHQFYNALYFANNNAAVLILDNDLTVKSLVENVKMLLNDEKRRKQIASNCTRLFIPRAAERIARVVLSLCEKKEIQQGGI